MNIQQVMIKCLNSIIIPLNTCSTSKTISGPTPFDFSRKSVLKVILFILLSKYSPVALWSPFVYRKPK